MSLRGRDDTSTGRDQGLEGHFVDCPMTNSPCMVADVVSCNYFCSMKTVGVRELKAGLSRYLRDVQAGEVILVTDRGRVVAELRQPGRPGASVTAVDRALGRLAETGGLRVGEPPATGVYARSPVRVQPGTSEALLDEERDEG